MKLERKKLLKAVGLIGGCFVLAAAAFYISYYFSLNSSTNSYEVTLRKYISSISKTNESTSTLFNSNKLDDKKTVQDIDNKIDALLKIKQSILNLIPTEKYNIDQNNLVSGLENNIMIFKQINEIAKNPQAKDLDSALTDLKKYESDCVSFYSQVSISGTHISLGDTCTNFINSALSFGTDQVNSRKDNEVLQSQNIDFVNSLDGIIKTFNPINVNLYSNVSTLSDSNYQNIMLSITNTKNDFNNIKESFNNLTIPSSAIDVYKSLSSLINDYDSYMQSFCYAVDMEKYDKDNSNTLSDADINQLYDDSNNKFTAVTNDYKEFIQVYTEYKNSSIQ